MVYSAWFHKKEKIVPGHFGATIPLVTMKRYSSHLEIHEHHLTKTNSTGGSENPVQTTSGSNLQTGPSAWKSMVKK